MLPGRNAPHDFDIAALFDALDVQRRNRALSWQGVAREIWNQSAVLNAHRDDHPISASTLTGMPNRRDTTCQHALFMLRWLGRTPEASCRVPRLTQRERHFRPPVLINGFGRTFKSSTTRSTDSAASEISHGSNSHKSYYARPVNSAA
jgi:hypothetical protein